MQLTSKDPDVQTILRWIEEQRIDLEPDFQRGEVWNVSKKQLLIDTIMRNWQMPPIFIVVDEEMLSKDVLDGHQRLTTIYQFYNGQFPIDGNLHPVRNEFEEIDGCYYHDLPERLRRKFLDFSIRVFEITNHQRDEPFELFYRLNEGVKLTPAERRNTFFGELRGQVKELAEYWEHIGLNTETLGFANARLAYHDILSRTLILLEKGDLSKKLTDREITSRYRSESGAPNHIEKATRHASYLLSGALNSGEHAKFSARFRRFSKPTLFSILYFIAKKLSFGIQPAEWQISRLVFELSDLQAGYAYSDGRGSPEDPLTYELFEYYKYRSSTSVNDARSLIIRNYFLNYIWISLGVSESQVLSDNVLSVTNRYIQSGHKGEDMLYEILLDHGWSYK